MLDEALEPRLPSGTSGRLLDAGINPVGDPKLDLGELPARGPALRFSIEVGGAAGGRARRLQGARGRARRARGAREAVEAELERLREGFAKLNPVERAATAGDVVLIDFDGKIDGEPFEGGTAGLPDRARRRPLLPEVREGARGDLAGRGAHRSSVTFPDDYPAEELPGKMPPSTSPSRRSARRTSPTSTTTSPPRPPSSTLSTSSATRLRTPDQGHPRRAERRAFRETALDAAAENAKIDLPHLLVQARAHETWEPIERQLAPQGIDPEPYLADAGQDPRPARSPRPAPRRSARCKREAVLAAVADAEGIEPTDADLLEALRSRGATRIRDCSTAFGTRGRTGCCRQ